jgi:hypothetical protein
MIDSPPPFDRHNLHDAHIQAISFEWSAGRLIISVAAFLDGLNADALPCELRWSGVRDFHVERSLPWGVSNCINAARFLAPHHYELEMQSGDTFTIDADNFDLHRVSSLANPKA